jgi:hypothetical protein
MSLNSGFDYNAKVILAGEGKVIPPMEFTKDDGTRLNLSSLNRWTYPFPATYKLIEMDTSHGNGTKLKVRLIQCKDITI